MTNADLASGAGAAASGAGTIWAFVSQAADVVFGMPIQVVLACLFGSAAARTYIGSVGFWKTSGLILLYAGLGAYTAPLVMHLSGLPTSVAAGVGVVISGGLQLPQLRDWLVDLLKGIVQKWTGGNPPAPPAEGGKP